MLYFQLRALAGQIIDGHPQRLDALLQSGGAVLEDVHHLQREFDPVFDRLTRENGRLDGCLKGEGKKKKNIFGI